MVGKLAAVYADFMDWKQFDKEIRSLAVRIDWKPDAVIGIARGGVVPAVLLSKFLKVKDMYVLKVRREGTERRIMAEIVPDVAGMHILLVEDMLETGKSMIAAKEYLEERGVEVKTTCLYTMPQSEIKPDFSLKEITEVVPFPWE